MSKTKWPTTWAGFMCSCGFILEMVETKDDFLSFRNCESGNIGHYSGIVKPLTAFAAEMYAIAKAASLIYFRELTEGE